MKRKGWVILGIVVAVLVLCIILIWPAAPLLVRLGAEPVCIQGRWPDDVAEWSIWVDPVAADEVPLAVDILVEPGPNQGQMVVTDQAPNAVVYLAPDADQIRALAVTVLGR